jgi:hypothetical protein
VLKEKRKAPGGGGFPFLIYKNTFILMSQRVIGKKCYNGFNAYYLFMLFSVMYTLSIIVPLLIAVAFFTVAERKIMGSIKKYVIIFFFFIKMVGVFIIFLNINSFQFVITMYKGSDFEVSKKIVVLILAFYVITTAVSFTFFFLLKKTPFLLNF